ncbi:alpha/beta hydrolase [Ktedonosporobacter rubrisoli]|nr:alpha/beta hydrolase [Ktedonosporobacter rubrisoli]
MTDLIHDAAPPQFEKGPCAFKASMEEGKTLKCGALIVPENRSKKDSKMIKLPVAIFKPASAPADAIPSIRMDGGPGGSSLKGQAAPLTEELYDKLYGDQVWIMFDQRGTGYAEPYLGCPEVMQAKYAAMQGQEVQGDPQQQCHDRLVQSGVDLNGYNTIQNAADVRDLAQALGYKQVNLYGVSYGSRLTLSVMRLFPDMVRSAIIDGVYPTQIEHGDDVDRDGAIERLIKSCEQNEACAHKYPQLRQHYDELLSMAQKKPLSFQDTDPETQKTYQVSLDGTSLKDQLFQDMYSPDKIPGLPLWIEQLHAGNTTTAAKYYEMPDQMIDESEVRFDEAPQEAVATGVYSSIECSEDLKSVQPRCKIWNVEKVPAEQKQPVSSSIPTVVMNGAFDPVTPPAWGEMAAKTLSNSTSVEFAPGGHGALNTFMCANQIAYNFYKDPGQKPDTSCATQVPPVQFS